jgi:hypothetical protein
MSSFIRDVRSLRSVFVLHNHRRAAHHDRRVDPTHRVRSSYDQRTYNSYLSSNNYLHKLDPQHIDRLAIGLRHNTAASAAMLPTQQQQHHLQLFAIHNTTAS